MPYYVANLNIEATYAAVSGQFAEYPNLCFVDTLDNVAGLGIRAGQQMDLLGALSDENIERVKRQNRRKISVIIGNPPYNAWQENFNMRNPNRAYRRVDERIKHTYIAKGTAQNKNSVYDMYTRFYRWASDRLHDDGVLALITNRNFIEKAAFDGFRKDVAEEFSDIYVVDLGGDIRTNPKLSGTKHNVFGIQTGVTITFMVKRKGAKGSKIHYVRRPEFDTAEDKLSWLAGNPANRVTFERIEPDKKSNWLDVTDNDWDELLPIASKEVKAGKRGAGNKAIFRLFSSGLKTQRDDWVYDFDPARLEEKVRYLIATYEATRADDDYPDKNSIKWDRELEKYLKASVQKRFETSSMRKAAFRPFVSSWVYFDKHFNGMTYQLPSMFPPGKENKFIAFPQGGRLAFCIFSDTRIPNLTMLSLDANQCLPRHRYSKSGEKIDNITDWALKHFQAEYGKTVTKDDIFHYVYGVLHDPVYRETYAINLKREFPRIPFYPDFKQWVEWGKDLMGIHIGYEDVEPWPLERLDTPDEKARDNGVAPKTMLKADKDNGIIRLDSETQLSGIPPQVWDYKLGNRSALEWILDQHKEKTPRDPTIREKFNTYRFADYKEKVIDLLMRVTRVSVETVAITEAMKAAKR